MRQNCRWNIFLRNEFREKNATENVAIQENCSNFISLIFANL